MIKGLKSVAWRYGLALLSVILTVFISWLLSYYSISLNLTILIVLALLVPAWYGGRGPGILVGVLFEAISIYFKPPTPEVGLEAYIFSHFSILALYVFMVLLTTSRRSAEKRLREQRELLQVTLASIGDAVIATDTKSIINFINPTAEHLTGWTEKEVIGKQLDEIFQIVNEETRAPVESPFEVVTREGIIVGLANHTVLLTKDGREIPIEDSGAPIRDAKGKTVGVIIVFHDVSERRGIEREREQLLRREQAARSEAENAGRLKDEFLATVSHELRTPLSAILGWSALLKNSTWDDDWARNAFAIIERNAKAQAGIIGDILDVSSIITGKMQINARLVRLSPVIETAVENLSPAARAKSIKLTFTAGHERDAVLGDIDRLQQIFWNLLSNAIKFTPENGRIEISTEEVDEHLVVKVFDTGIGIDEELLPFIFDRFRQGDSSSTRNYGGLGLGLSIVRHLAELHGGTVTAKSEGANKGTVFTITLPLASETEPELNSGDVGETALERAVDILANIPDLIGLHVLVVDDDADTLEVLSVALSRYGAKVRTALSGTDGLKTFLEWKPNVLISDLAMPGEDGFALIGKIRALPPEQGGNIPAAALTAYAGETDRSNALAAGFQAHIPKPVDPTALAAAVMELVNRENH